MGLTCTYNSIPQKKGPRGRRAKVLNELRNELRNEQRDASLASGTRLSSDGSSFPRCVRTPGLLPPMLLEQCVDFFFASIYPLQPVLELPYVQEAIVNMNLLDEVYSMVLAFCAYAIM